MKIPAEELIIVAAYLEIGGVRVREIMRGGARVWRVYYNGRVIYESYSKARVRAAASFLGLNLARACTAGGRSDSAHALSASVSLAQLGAEKACCLRVRGGLALGSGVLLDPYIAEDTAVAELLAAAERAEAHIAAPNIASSFLSACAQGKCAVKPAGSAAVKMHKSGYNAPFLCTRWNKISAAVSPGTVPKSAAGAIIAPAKALQSGVKECILRSFAVRNAEEDILSGLAGGYYTAAKAVPLLPEIGKAKAETATEAESGENAAAFLGVTSNCITASPIAIKAGALAAIGSKISAGTDENEEKTALDSISLAEIDSAAVIALDIMEIKS